MKKRKVICDIETESLTPNIIHCIAAIDEDTDEVFTFDPSNIKDFKEFAIEEIDTYVGHNFLTFDAPNISRILDVPIEYFRGEDGLGVEDTLIMSRLMYTGLRNQHSLDSWGETLNYPKIEFNGFDRFSDKMMEYCINDVKLNQHLYRYFKKNGLNNISQFCVWLEHRTQYLLNQQQRNGFFMDIDKVYALNDEISSRLGELTSAIKEAFPPVDKLVEVYTPRLKKDGSLPAPAIRKLENAYRYEKRIVNGAPQFSIYESEEFNIGSPKQVVERMNDLGWRPVEFTKAGAPKCSEANFETLPPDAPKEARLIADWLVLNSRQTVIKGWLDNYNPTTGCIHGRTLGIGAITHRMAHRDPNMANIPAVRSEYGEEMRSVFKIRDDRYKMVGVDISGIQLRILAHYMEDPKYTEAVCFGRSEDGTDIHSVQRDIIREVYPDCDRDGAKKFIYSMLLGASGFKLGVDLGADKPAEVGTAAKAKLFQRIPAFKRVQKMCSNAAKRGYMIGLDGRRAVIKSEHFALSVYLQNGEAIIMKYALHLASLRAAHLNYKQLVVVHDEVQCEVLAEHAEELGKIIVECIEEAGRFFELRCPVTGGYKIGNNWAETH